MNRDDGSERMNCFDEKRCHVIQHGIFLYDMELLCYLFVSNTIALEKKMNLCCLQNRIFITRFPLLHVTHCLKQIENDQADLP